MLLGINKADFSYSVNLPFRTRLTVGLLLALVLCFWPSAWRFAAPALSPFLAVCSAIAVRSLSLAGLLGLPMFVWVMVRRRFWCRRLCPVGLISESCGKVRAARASGGAKLAAPADSWPPARILALATLGGALAGYPLFLWMDPLALFAGFFSVARIVRPDVPPYAAAGLPLLMLISFLYPGMWCSRLCPLGGTQDLLALSVQFWRRRKAMPPALGAFSRGRRVFLSLGAGTLFGTFLPKSWGRPSRSPAPSRCGGRDGFSGRLHPLRELLPRLSHGHHRTCGGEV